MRFNTPPSWPAAPEGWSPPAGWSPEATWPLPEPGWSFWLTDEGLPAPVVDPSVQAWDPRAVGAPLTASADLADAPLTEDDLVEVAAVRKKALGVFALGVLVFLIGAGSALYAANSTGGGTVWTGGMLFGAVLFWRAWSMHRALRKIGAPKNPSPIGRVVVAGGGAVCLVVGVLALVAVTGDSTPSFAEGELVGTCWSDAPDDMLDQVSCGDAHDYTVVDEVTDPETCPEASLFSVELTDSYGCLVED